MSCWQDNNNTAAEEAAASNTTRDRRSRIVQWPKYLTLKRLRKQLDHSDPESGPATVAEEVLQKDTQALGELVLKLEDLASSLRDSMYRARDSAAHSTEQSEKPSYFIRFLLPVVALAQLMWVCLLATFDSMVTSSSSYGYLVHTIAVVLQLAAILHVGLASWRLTHQLLRYRATSGFLMAQTYLSTVLLFAGFYLIIYRVDPNSWETSPTDPIRSGTAFMQHVRMLYLSVSSATLCGAANIQPISWYATVTLCFQSLVNFIYFASILAQTIGNHNPSSEAGNVIERRKSSSTVSRQCLCGGNQSPTL